MSETIHVAYCLDDGYTEPTCVSMASMLVNTKSNVHFHIISNKLSNENKAKLSSLYERFSHGEWSFHRIDFDTSGFILEQTNHPTIETYYRFFIPKILPELEKIIYIDGDTVIVGDILELWNENLDGKVAGVVQDGVPESNPENRLKIFGLKYNWQYFNAGVLLLKLKEFEKLYTLETLPIIIKNLHRKFKDNNVFWLQDQDVLNFLFNCEKYAKYLNLKYNLEDQNINFYYYLYGQSSPYLRDWSEANKSPIIIHYSGTKKPWHLNNDIMRAVHWRLYYKYKALTPFYDLLDEKRIAEYDRRKRLTKTEALIPVNLYIELFWQDIFIHSAENVKRVIGNRKLAFWGAGLHITHIMTMFASCGLYPDVVVDGLASNYGKTFFEYTVQSASVLQEKPEEHFVVLCMETKRARDAVVKILKEYGYSENGFVHAYTEAYERENKSLI